MDYGALGAGRVLAAMHAINEMGRSAMATGSLGPVLPGRPAAILAGIPAGHADFEAFLAAGSPQEGGEPSTGQGLGPFDLTARLVRFDTAWLLETLRTGEPGEAMGSAVRAAMSRGVGLGFDLFEREAERLRGPTSGATGARSARVPAAEVNLSRIETAAELADVTQLAVQFLLCDAACASRPAAPDAHEAGAHADVRLALGLTGLHEWLIRRGQHYDTSPELGRWLAVWKGSSAETASWFSDALGIARPSACRAVGSDRVLARLSGTTTGVEPVSAVSYRIAGAPGGSPVQSSPLAKWLSESCSVAESDIESGLSLAGDVTRSLDLHAQVQTAVDQSVSAVIRIPEWDSPGNSEAEVETFASLVAARAHLLRSVTFEPEGRYSGARPGFA